MLFIFENIEKEKGEKKLGFTVDPNSTRYPYVDAEVILRYLIYLSV